VIGAKRLLLERSSQISCAYRKPKPAPADPHRIAADLRGNGISIRQYRRKPARCQRTKVSGRMIDRIQYWRETWIQLDQEQAIDRGAVVVHPFVQFATAERGLQRVGNFCRRSQSASRSARTHRGTRRWSNRRHSRGRSARRRKAASAHPPRPRECATSSHRPSFCKPPVLRREPRCGGRRVRSRPQETQFRCGPRGSGRHRPQWRQIRSRRSAGAPLQPYLSWAGNCLCRAKH
jgi:hypothetical protein